MSRAGGLCATAILFAFVAGFAAKGHATHDREKEELDVALLVARVGTRAVAHARPSIVSISTLGSGEEGFGAGLVVNREGTILTALHVVKGAAAIAVRYDDGAELPARVTAEDPRFDLALVEPIGASGDFTPVTWGDDRHLAIGAPLFALGNPFGLRGTVSRGVLSARGRRGVVPGNQAALFQTDAAVNPGSSGGALIDLRGEVVGMVTAILTRSGEHQGAAFAVPASDLRSALPALLEGRRPDHPWLGLRVSRLRDGAGAGLRVVEVVRGGPAHAAGVAPGDRLITLASRRLEGLADLRSAIRETAVGAAVATTIQRGDRLLTLELTVDRKKP